MKIWIYLLVLIQNDLVYTKKHIHLHTYTHTHKTHKYIQISLDKSRTLNVMYTILVDGVKDQDFKKISLVATLENVRIHRTFIPQ